ncbi:hypothetical protein SERLA73DRAFT_166837 [Serpula lacrymans var. lacrymans S7.3]|uniref:GED domain-containing protein n=2 Tax=Serpula lacrymans var. lacrymans TaxID=341189 RepID=F8PTI7_SERL3|nr:uncharacterized protein SERLADRAFT_435922 [Serpula lacrymans var. lacrymans S7.9]EGO00515.1 hypothetical protein SERLA73DRAFT_166837 [Serpula lacrymans var. lacrymans S7.3]EGO26074.1 hypothetical protein SERLADRAFT_435922 [Serpula lacrymans var. lacrymans S7.9]
MGDRMSDQDTDVDFYDVNDAHPISSNGVGLSAAGLSKERRKLLDLINRLHSTGVQIDMDLPMIAVIGVQSAGKSSLIEAISGVTLPRSSGTCTRCPTECRLSQSNQPWKCVVSLRFITNALGQPLGQVRNENFGDTITDKADVEDRVRRAQHAILNPDKPASTYLTGTLASEERGLSFSQNCVCLAICGPEVADLSFCDLPGLIATAGQGGDASDVELVRSLVSSYIEKPSCVILSTVACETDFEIQGAHDLAKKLDPQGTRTVGVLTKPDRIPPGEEYRWMEFIKDERERLINGWYCVKQPDSKSLREGLSWAGARKKENDYFATQPWTSLPPMYQSHLRTSNLTARLSTILSELIASRLPGIYQDLYDLIDSTDMELRKLPKAPSVDAAGEVLELVNGFTRALSRRLEGTPEEDGLLQKIRPTQSKFKRAIRATAPEFCPFGLGETWDAIPGFIANEEDEVLDRAQKARTRELPDNYPFVVQKEYIMQCIDQWRNPALSFFESVYEILKEDLENVVDYHFGNLGRGALQNSISLTVKDHLDLCAQQTQQHIEWLLAVEKSPNTLNVHYYSDYKDKFLSFYKGCRNDRNHGSSLESLKSYQTSQDPHYEDAVNNALSALNEMGISGIQAADLAKLFPVDPMEPALIIMAGVRAYFQVSYKRFVDIIPLAIDHDLVLGLERGIQKAIVEDLQLTGPDVQERCRFLLQEQPGIRSKREELERKRKRLNTAKEEIRHLGF